MNNSKKILSGAPAEKSKPIATESKKSNKNIILIAALAIIVVVLVIGLCYDAFRPKYLLTINDKKYTLDDLKYYFYTTEQSYQSINDLYEQLMPGYNYWDNADETGTMTNRSAALNDALDLAIQTELLYDEAIEKGYALTEEEVKQTNDKVDDILNNILTPAQVKKTKFNVTNLTEAITKSTIAARYREDLVAGFDIDTEAAKATIDYEKYRQYDIEYFYARTNSQDETGNVVELTQNEKNALMEKITAFYATAKDTEDWSTAVPEDEEEIKYTSKGFITGISGFPTEFEDQIKALNNGETTEPTIADNGIYAVRMVNNNSSERYDTEVETAITTAENTKFNEYFNDLLSSVDYSINKNVASTIYMGEVTLP